MERYDQIAGNLALTLGAAWASGINLHAAMAVPGFGGSAASPGSNTRNISAFSASADASRADRAPRPERRVIPADIMIDS